jgi:hypothetical protein
LDYGEDEQKSLQRIEEDFGVNEKVVDPFNEKWRSSPVHERLIQEIAVKITSF